MCWEVLQLSNAESAGAAKNKPQELQFFTEDFAARSRIKKTIQSRLSSE